MVCTTIIAPGAGPEYVAKISNTSWANPFLLIGKKRTYMTVQVAQTKGKKILLLYLNINKTTK